jgi:hypothetical protein
VLQQINKLRNATKRYGLKPLTSLHVEHGTVHWSPHELQLPEELAELDVATPAVADFDEECYTDEEIAEYIAVHGKFNGTRCPDA